MTESPTILDEIRHFAATLTDITRPLIHQYFRQRPIIRQKQDKSPVTVADERVETTLRRAILARYPDHNIIGEEQTGFRPGYSTMDHIFSLKCIIDTYLSCNKKVFTAFVDYEKAFDRVDRVYLWQKLLKNNMVRYLM